jgi:hypothetical protein
MRVNVYAEEMTDKIAIISKEIDGRKFTGIRFYLELPATVNGEQHQGPFIHRPGDDDSSAVTFWGKRDLREVLQKALELLNKHYNGAIRPAPAIESEAEKEAKAYIGNSVMQRCSPVAVEIIRALLAERGMK